MRSVELGCVWLLKRTLITKPEICLQQILLQRNQLMQGHVLHLLGIFLAL